MNVHRTTAVATYSGDARIWQDANVVQAPSLQFDRDLRSVVAQGDGQPVSTVLVQVDKKGNATPVSISSGRLTYTDDQHRAHFEGGVIVRGADATLTADHLDAFMIPRSQRRPMNRLKGKDSSTGWLLRERCLSRSRRGAPRVRNWSTPWLRTSLF